MQRAVFSAISVFFTAVVCKKQKETPLDRCEVCTLVNEVAVQIVSKGKALEKLCEPYEVEGTWLRKIEVQGTSFDVKANPTAKCTKTCRTLSRACDEFLTSLMDEADVIESLHSGLLCDEVCDITETQDAVKLHDVREVKEAGGAQAFRVEGVVACAAIFITAIWWCTKNVRNVAPNVPDAQHLRSQRLASLSAQSSSSHSGSISDQMTSGERACVTVREEESAADAMQAWRRQRAAAKCQEVGQDSDKQYEQLTNQWHSYLDDDISVDEIWDVVKDDVLTHSGAGVVATVLSPKRSLLQRKKTFCIPPREFVSAVGGMADANSDLFIRFIDKLSSEVMEHVDAAAELILDFNASPDAVGNADPLQHMTTNVLNRRLSTQMAWTDVKMIVVLLCAFAGAGAQIITDREDTTGLLTRLALALNYVLFRLMGPPSKRFSSLIHSWDVPAVMVVEQTGAGFVLNAAFDPGTLLLSVLYTFNRLGQGFLRVAARDQQYFRARCFMNAAAALPTLTGSSSSMVRIADKLEAEARAVAQEEARINAVLLDYPEDFQCVLGYDLMRDPVRLPCGQIVDRAFMVRHLRSSSTDPFTRLPMVEADLVADSQLKVRIDAWISEQLSNQQQDEASLH